MTVDDSSAIPQLVDELDTQPVAQARRILVVDDTPANLVAMEVALAPLQRPVLCVASGRQALSHLLEEDFSLILLDVEMPEIDGFETAALIRACRRTRHLPIIFVTAHTMEPAQVRRAYRLGAVDFLFKPIEPEILLAKAGVFVALQVQADALAGERLRRDFDGARRDYERAAHHRQLARLAEEDRRKDRFLAMLSHELRNPLASIRTAIDLASESSERTIHPRLLELLDRQTTQLTRRLDDLLDVAKIKADTLEPRTEDAGRDPIERLARPEIARRLRIVVVDDNNDIRELIGNVLSKHGHDVVAAESGRSGLSILRESQPDVALLDLGLPDLDGIELVRELRGEFPDLPTRLIAMTGYGQPADIERTSKAGFHVHLVKPVTSERLLRALTETITVPANDSPQLAPR